MTPVAMTTTIFPRNNTKVPIELIAATLRAFAICSVSNIYSINGIKIFSSPIIGKLSWQLGKNCTHKLLKIIQLSSL